MKDDKKIHNFDCTRRGEVVMRCYVSTCLIKSKLPSTRCKIYVTLEMIFERQIVDWSGVEYSIALITAPAVLYLYTLKRIHTTLPL